MYPYIQIFSETERDHFFNENIPKTINSRNISRTTELLQMISFNDKSLIAKLLLLK